jgi:hypothetical protein
MPARNLYHEAVIRALQADGWTITHDPLTISFGGRDLFVDLGAERETIGAEKGGKRIAVEIQSFAGASPIRDLEEAVGQFEVYRAVLAKTDPDRTLHLAVPKRVHEGILVEPLGQLIIGSLSLRLIVFDEAQGKIVSWIN